MGRFNPEIGQAIFSTSRWDEHEMEPHVEDGIRALGSLIEAFTGKPAPTGNVGDFYENCTFAIRAYCWCDGEGGGHEGGCPPNFEHFSSGFRAGWYKYLGRGSSQGCRRISTERWGRILRHCVTALLADTKREVRC